MNGKRIMIRPPKKTLFLKRWSKQAARERASERYPSRVPLARDFSRKPPNGVLVHRLEFKALNRNKPEFFWENAGTLRQFVKLTAVLNVVLILTTCFLP